MRNIGNARCSTVGARRISTRSKSASSRLIEEWLAYEAQRADFTVEAGEEKLAATVGELKLQVRVDRIDAVEGGRVIIDYKTGMLIGGFLGWPAAR